MTKVKTVKLKYAYPTDAVLYGIVGALITLISVISTPQCQKNFRGYITT